MTQERLFPISGPSAGARHTQGGFSLLELLVVMIIIGLLAALVAPRFFKHVGKSKTGAAKAQIELLGQGLEQFRLDVGRFPTTSEGLKALTANPGIEGWDGPYLKKQAIPLDPWNKEYHYASPGAHGDYDLYTFGADNTEGGEKDNADVKSWE